MKRNRILLSLIILLAMAWLVGGLVSGVTADSDESLECPRVVRRGELIITVPAGENSGSATVTIPRCPDFNLNVQVTGGSMLNTPIIVNAKTQNDVMTVTAYLTEKQPGPVDVTVWWRFD